jgi:hypothetical protein
MSDEPFFYRESGERRELLAESSGISARLFISGIDGNDIKLLMRRILEAPNLSIRAARAIYDWRPNIGSRAELLQLINTREFFNKGNFGRVSRSEIAKLVGMTWVVHPCPCCGTKVGSYRPDSER